MLARVTRATVTIKVFFAHIYSEMWLVSNLLFLGFFVDGGGVFSDCFGDFAQLIVLVYLIVVHNCLLWINEVHTLPFEQVLNVEVTRVSVTVLYDF